MRELAAWRVIYSEPSDGYANMAVDEAIMEAVGRELVPPTLRLYGWQPPAVSLGCFQELDGQVDLAALRSRGWDLVRRPTGGRAILHDDEVTYSVSVPQDMLKGGHSVLRSYRELSRGIQHGLELLGVRAELGNKPKPHDNAATGGKLPAICFTQSTRADMVAQGRKIVGSAQVRRDGTILQHGSVPLTLNVADHLVVMPTIGGEDGAAMLRRAAVGISELLGRAVSFDEVAEALVKGLARVLGVQMCRAELTELEQARAQELRTGKYATEQWNYHRPTRE